MSCWVWGLLLSFATVSGTVENSEGQPVAGARVEWNFHDGLTHIWTDPVVRTDENGRFKLNLFRFQEGVLEVTAAGYAFTRTDLFGLPWHRRTDLVRIVVPDGLAVHGRVIGPDDAAVADAWVITPDHYRIGIRSTETERTVAFTASDGSFKADTLQRGKETLLQARATGYSPGEVTVSPQPADDQIDVVIRLKKELSIEGRVLDINGNPVRARLFAMETQESAQTDKTGAFKLPRLPHGENTIFLIPEGYAPREIKAEAGENNLIIRLGSDEPGE